jgi:hypothetical protein
MIKKEEENINLEKGKKKEKLDKSLKLGVIIL